MNSQPPDRDATSGTTSNLDSLHFYKKPLVFPPDSSFLPSNALIGRWDDGFLGLTELP